MSAILKEDPKVRQEIIDDFHRLYAREYKPPTWLGHRIQKCPLDLFIYQEILFETVPDVIIECGAAEGGSGLYLAGVCDLINNGRVISIDVNRYANAAQHPRLKYVHGDVLSERIFYQLGGLIHPTDRVMVILDDDHSKEHVLKELYVYGRLVTRDCYLIVEDSNIHGHPVGLGYPAGPYEAIEEFMADNTDFEIDKSREKFFLTFNPNGYLRRITE